MIFLDTIGEEQNDHYKDDHLRIYGVNSLKVKPEQYINTSESVSESHEDIESQLTKRPRVRPGIRPQAFLQEIKEENSEEDKQFEGLGRQAHYALELL